MTLAGTETTLLMTLIALSPPELAGLNAAVRPLCAHTTGLSALPSESTAVDVDPAVLEFAEQFSIDVSAIDVDLRTRFAKALGPKTFSATALIFIADFVPRVRLGFDAFGLDWPGAPTEWDHAGEPADVLLNGFAPAVGRMRELDPVTSEIVRLRGARQHNCRLCKSLREGTALDAGGTESMYGDIDSYETSDLSERHKAALRYVDALIWQPTTVMGTIPAVREHFSETEAIELTLDVMRNACNKIAVALGADAPRIPDGTERYLLGADGHPVYR